METENLFFFEHSLALAACQVSKLGTEMKDFP